MYIGAGSAAAADVYKCADGRGRITYQQRPCPTAERGARLDVTPASAPAGGGDDPAAIARGKEIVPGMSRAQVVQAIGTPQSMRPGTVQENAAEVWVYKRPDFSTLIGFNGGVVAWRREPIAPGSAPAGEDGPVGRSAAIVIGRDCRQIAAQIGPPESVTEEPEDPVAGKALRYVWEAQSGETVRTVAICLNGLVTRVDRSPVP